MPEQVRQHPRVFATLTAPSFGPVRTGPDHSGRRRVCHPRRDGLACWRRHAADDPAVGQPLDPASYDYVGHVLWNAHAGALWRRLAIYLRRHLAKAAGITQRQFHHRVRVSFAKVAEYQRRGVAHFHAVIRLAVGGEAQRAVTRVQELITARMPTPDEAYEFQTIPGVPVFSVERTHWADDLSVETADIVIRADRYVIDAQHEEPL